MRARLDASNIAIADISDQPPSSHVLIVAEHFGGRCALAVDDYNTSYQDKVVRFFRGLEMVAILPTHTTWMLVKRESMSTLTTRDYLEKFYKDVKEVGDLEKELKEKYKTVDDSTIGFQSPKADVMDFGYR